MLGRCRSGRCRPSLSFRPWSLQAPFRSRKDCHKQKGFHRRKSVGHNLVRLKITGLRNCGWSKFLQQYNWDYQKWRRVARTSQYQEPQKQKGIWRAKKCGVTWFISRNYQSQKRKPRLWRTETNGKKEPATRIIKCRALTYLNLNYTGRQKV